MNQFVILLLGLINLSFEVEYFGPQSVTQNVCSYDGGHLEVRLFDCGKPCPQDWTTLPSGSQQNALTGNVTNCTPGQIRSRCQCDCEMAWFGTFPFCSGECPLGYIEMKRDKKPEGLWYQCLTGTKALCKTCKGATTPGGQTNNITSQIPGNISNRNTTQLDKNANSRNISQSGFFN